MTVAKKVLILVGRNPKDMRGGASTWILNMDPFFKRDFLIFYLILPELLLRISFIPDRLKAFVHTFFFLLSNRKKYDLFFSHSPELSYIATLFSKKVIHIAHGNTNPMTNPTFRLGKLFFRLFQYFDRYIHKNALILFTVGEERQGYIKISQPINHDIIPLCFKKKKDFIFAGRLEKVKNIDLIIKSYHSLPLHVKKSHAFFIYGSGSEHKALKRLITELDMDDYIFLKGHIKNYDLIEKINQSRVLLMASDFEGFPMVIAESLTVGTPVISTNVGSINSVIKDRFNGILVPKVFVPSYYANEICYILDNFEKFCLNSLESAKSLNASEVYSVIKKTIDKRLVGK